MQHAQFINQSPLFVASTVISMQSLAWLANQRLYVFEAASQDCPSQFILRRALLLMEFQTFRKNR